MLKDGFGIAFAGVLLLSGAAQGFAETTSTVSEVTVYPDGANVTRIATVDLQSGVNEITFVGLAADVDPYRFQLSFDDSGLEVGHVSFADRQRATAFDEEIARIEEAIFDVKSEIQGLDDAVSSAQLQLKFLDGIATGFAKESWTQAAQGAADIDSWNRALAVLSDGANEAHERVRDSASERRDLNARLSQLQRELRNMSGGERASQMVKVTVRAATAGEATARLTYFLDDASWYPVYDARLDSTTRALRLAQTAEVVQASSEDWTDVKLTLATLQPTGELRRPELDPLFVTYRPVAPPSQPRVARSRAADMIEEMVVTGSRISRWIGNYGVSYEIPGQVSIENDADDATSVQLTESSFDVDLVTQVVPRDNDAAFLVAQFEYDDPAPLLAGQMRIYLNGAYAGITEMDIVRPGEALALPMGQDRSVVVRAEDQGGENAVGGIVGRRRQEVTDWLFTVTNRHSVGAAIEVFDRYPVSRESSIDVEVPRTATAPSERDLDEQPGLIVWRKTLGPDEVWQIKHQYEVSYPADRTIVTN